MLTGTLLLFAIPLVLRLGMTRDVEQPWSSRVDLFLALVAGVFYAWGCLELAAEHAGLDPSIEGTLLSSSISTDFFEYCGGVGSMLLDDVDGWPAKRSRGAAWLPALLAEPLGILDGLAMGAVLSCGLIGSGLFLWGRAIGGRTAGLVAPLLALAMGPMVLLVRMLSFYPEIIASFVLASAAAAWAIRSRTPWSMVCAGIGVGVVLLMDVRGLMWALPLAGGVGLAALVAGPREDGSAGSDRLLLLVSLCIPVAISYFLGGWAYPEHTTSLEQQVDLRALFRVHGATGSEFLPPYDYDTHFRWGRSAVQEIPQTLIFLFEQSRFQPPEGLATPAGVGSAEQHIKPWMILGGLGLVGAALVVKLRSWRVWALFCTLFPFAVALRGMDVVEEMQPRILTHWMPGLALLLGLGFTAILRLPGPRAFLESKWTAPSWRLLAGTRAMGVFAVLLLLGGVVESWWASDADWRTRWDQPQLIVQNKLDPKGDKTSGPEGQATAEIGGGLCLSCREACWQGLQRDWNRGLRFEIDSYADPLASLSTALSGGWSSIWRDGGPNPAELPEGVLVHIEERGTTLIVGFVGISGTPKDSLLVAEVEADLRYEEMCMGAYLARTWTHEPIGWEPLLMGVLLELAGEKGLAPDRDTVTDLEFEIWEQMEDWDDVDTLPLDTVHLQHNSLTEEESDDCGHENLGSDALWAQDYDVLDANGWKSSPTAQVFVRRSTPLIDELEAMGRIRYR